MKVDGESFSRTDPETAHKAASDPGWTLFIPQSCLYCRAQELAKANENLQIAAKTFQETLDA